MSVAAGRGMSAWPADLVRAVSPASALGATLLALAIAAGVYVLEHNVGLDLADEGFLWYGAWRTLLGEVPLRDFDSYDPGRYYWAALWLRLFGNDIFVLRLSGAVVHAAALVTSLALLRRATRNPWFLSAATLVIACWLFPRHKPFEPAIALFGVYAATRMIESASTRSVFMAGVFVGAAAFVGRNHGVYLATAFLALLAWLRMPHGARALARDAVTLGAGVVIGYVPLLAMLAFVPGFWRAFAGSFGPFLTITPLPLLWTWNELSSGAPLVGSVKLVSLGCLHILAPAMYAYLAVCLIRAARSGVPAPPVVVGATFVGAVYLHYMFSRADIRHFAQAVAPLLVGWGALVVTGHAGARRRSVAIVAGCFVLLTCGSVLLDRPVVRYWMGEEHYRTAAVKGRQLVVPPGVGRTVSLTAELGSRLPAGGGVLIVPNWPALYVLLDRPAPIRETYTLVPEDAERQRQIIRQLAAKDIGWIIVNDLSDNRRRAQFSFQTTHPLVWQHIRTTYARQPLAGAPPSYLLFRPTGTPGGA